MCDYDHNTLPSSLTESFGRSNLVHDYNTRYASAEKLHYYKINTSTYGINSFKYQWAKILNNLKDLNIYNNIDRKAALMKKLKVHLFIISSYSLSFFLGTITLFFPSLVK